MFFHAFEPFYFIFYQKNALETHANYLYSVRAKCMVLNHVKSSITGTEFLGSGSDCFGRFLVLG